MIMKNKRRILLALLVVFALAGTFCGGFSLARATPAIDLPGFPNVPQQINTYEVKVSIDGWTQEEKNYLQAAAVSLLFQANITYTDISVIFDPAKPKEATIKVINASGDASKVLTTTALKNHIVAQIEEMRIASQIAQAEALARELELAANEFTDINLADIDAKIDSCQDLAQLKELLKKFVRYVIARQ